MCQAYSLLLVARFGEEGAELLGVEKGCLKLKEGFSGPRRARLPPNRAVGRLDSGSCQSPRAQSHAFVSVAGLLVRQSLEMLFAAI